VKSVKEEKSVVLAVAVLSVLSMLVGNANAQQKLSVILSSEESEVYRGEPLQITTTVSNTTGEVVVLPSCLRIEVTQVLGGKTNNGIWQESVDSTYPEGVNRISPGGKLCGRIQLLSILDVLPEKHGSYLLRATLESKGQYFSEIDAKTGDKVYSSCWSGMVQSATASMVVKQVQNAEDRVVLQTLARGSETTLNDSGLLKIWNDAAARYEEILAQHPKSVFARHCEFYAAERGVSGPGGSAIAAAVNAIGHYKNVIEKYPAFFLADDAKLGLARVLIVHKEKVAKDWKSRATIQLQSILRDHPRSDVVDDAAKTLSMLRKSEVK
jgi:hypothetical protein